MNMLFWIIVAGMILIALAVVLYPLLKPAQAIDSDHRRRNIAIARQRLADLQQQLQDGSLDQAEFDAHYLELQAMLNDDLQLVDQAIAAGSDTRGRWMVPLLAVLIPVASLAWYFALGQIDALDKLALQQADSSQNASVEAAIPLLKQRLQQNAEDVEGWKLLGQSYALLQQHQSAVDAFAQAYKRAADDVDVLLSYASNLAAVNAGSMNGEAAQLIDKALLLQPDNADALWLAGIARIEQGNFPQALEYWRHLLTLLPPDAANYEQVQGMYAMLEQEESAKANVKNQASIKVQVGIDADLKSKFTAETTVFIYAQAASGPKMPLAIVRKQLSELPMEVVLDDSMAMQGSSKMSEQQRLRIIARVSKSGQAMSAPGDWLGSVEVNPPFTDQTVNLRINQEVK